MVRATHVNRSHRENSSIWKNAVTGHEVLGVWLSFVSVWVGTAGPYQLNSCQNLNLFKQVNKQTSMGAL